MSVTDPASFDPLRFDRVVVGAWPRRQLRLASPPPIVFHPSRPMIGQRSCPPLPREKPVSMGSVFLPLSLISRRLPVCMIPAA